MVRRVNFKIVDDIQSVKAKILFELREVVDRA